VYTLSLIDEEAGDASKNNHNDWVDSEKASAEECKDKDEEARNKLEGTISRTTEVIG
jgi:hypothetical protein